VEPRRVERYTPGTVVRGKVVSLKDYGAFIELEEGIEGLVHISEMSWTRASSTRRRWSLIGDMVEAVVLDIDVKNNRISLGMKQLEPNPYEQLTDKYPPAPRQGQGPQHRRLRYLRRDRGRHRRPGPHQRHELDPARQAPVGAVPEG
jgi:predicted RNA-binding protein with RPS1 domain